jgi:hypothetical protein
MATVLKQAMKVIGDVAESKGTTIARISNVENGLHDFLLIQEKKEKKADEERTKWRWALIAPTTAFAAIELIKWIFR